MIKTIPLLPILCLAFLLTSCSGNKTQTDIIVTLKPLHSIVLALTGHTNLKVGLLGGGISSPHDYALKPSDMKQLKSARLVIQVGSALERFLEKPLSQLPEGHQRLELMSIKGLTLLTAAHKHSHKNHGHEGADKESETDANTLSQTDPHIWLDPQNMIVIARHLQKTLSTLFPEQAFLIKQNELKLTGMLKQLDADIKKTLSPVKTQGFMVYHDAFAYFEKRYGLNNQGSVSLTAGQLPGSRHVVKIHNRLKENKIKCLFTQPGQQPPLVHVLTKNNAVKSQPLSPLGTALPASPHHYFQMMRELAKGYQSCLQG